MMILWFILFCFLMIVSFAFGTCIGGVVFLTLLAKKCPEAYAELGEALDVDIEVRSRHENSEENSRDDSQENQGAEM